MHTRDRSPLALLLAIPFAALIPIGCSSDNNHGPGPTGGPVTGALDTHCKGDDGGVMATVVGECLTGAEPTDAAAPEPDPDGGAPTSDYGDTLFNAEGDDDDCKYHVKFTSTAVRENQDVTFTFTATNRADGGATTGGKVYTETYLSAVHPAPNAATNTTEGP